MSYQFYTYWRSSAAYRVRIVLNIKQLTAEHIPIHLVKDGGEQHSARYKAVNPQGLVPALVDGDFTIGQSLAIMEYLDEVHPQYRILPKDAKARARVRDIALAVACDIHPIQNLRVRQYVAKEYGVGEEGAQDWMRHWMALGFEGIEAKLAGESATGKLCHGDEPTLADICLIPQMANARGMQLDIAAFPTIARIDEYARTLQPFIDAAPENQPDTPKND